MALWAAYCPLAFAACLSAVRVDVAVEQQKPHALLPMPHVKSPSLCEAAATIVLLRSQAHSPNSVALFSHWRYKIFLYIGRSVTSHACFFR